MTQPIHIFDSEFEQKVLKSTTLWWWTSGHCDAVHAR